MLETDELSFSYLPKCLCHFALPPTMNCENKINVSLSGPTSSSVFGVLYFGYSNRWVMVSCCFDLNFSDDICCGTSFHIFVCHLHILFAEVSVKVFGPVFSWCKRGEKTFLFYSQTCNTSDMRGVYVCVCFYSINSLTLVNNYNSIPFSSDINSLAQTSSG